MMVAAAFRSEHAPPATGGSMHGIDGVATSISLRDVKNNEHARAASPLSHARFAKLGEIVHSRKEG